jgi:UDP-glucose 4-epimerase
MKIFVTGGAGFIGSWVARVLLESGHEVVVFDNLYTGSTELIPEGAEFIEGDLLDLGATREALQGSEAVIHLAARTVVPESVEDPQAFFQANLVGGQNLLEAMRAEGVGKIVFSSTAAVYGAPSKVPIEEDDPKFPVNPYGATKLAYEQLLHAYHACYGLDVIMFRYFNPFGPGELDRKHTKAIPNFIRAILSGRPIPLYWQGEQERDFFYVEDIARAHALGLEQSGYEYYNLGSGKGTKVIDVVDLLGELMGVKPEIEDLGERAGDPPLLYASTEKAKRDLGWKATTPLEAGLKQTIEYYRAESRKELL